MPRTWKDLKSAMPPRTEARMARRADWLDAVLTLQELVRLRETIEREDADRLEQAQQNAARALSRANPRLSTLRDQIAALGGELELVARFPDRSYGNRTSEGE